MSKISDVVSLKTGYANFVELKSSFEESKENADRMAMYRPTKAHRKACERLCRGLYQPNDKKFYLLSGSYGTGKSHLCLMLANILSRASSDPEMVPFYETYSKLDADAGKTLRNVRKGGQYLVAICDYSSGRSFEERVLKAVFEACDKMGLQAGVQTEFDEADRLLGEWESKSGDASAIRNYYSDFEKALASVEPGTTVDQLRAELRAFNGEMMSSFRAAYKLAQGGTEFQSQSGNVIPIIKKLVGSKAFKERFQGLAIFFDEFGFTLEKAEYSKDVLQGFMESICQNLPNVMFVGCIHKSFEAYSDRYSKDDAAVMKARLTPVDLLSEGIEEIISAIVEANKLSDVWAAEVEPKLGVLDNLLPACDTLKLFPWIEDHNRIRERVLEDIYGVHPVALSCLLRLSSEVGSDVRSTFTFFSGDVGNESGSYKEFIENADICVNGGKLNLYTVDQLYTFFEEQLNPRNPELRDKQRQLVNGYVSSVDALLKSMQDDLFDEADDSRSRILKTVLIYQLCQIPCTLENIQFGLYALSNPEKKGVEKCLKAIEKAGALFFRKQSKTYELATGSGEDPYDLIEQYLKDTDQHDFDVVHEFINEGGSRKDLTYLEAKQHNLHFGEDKRLEMRFVLAKDLDDKYWNKIQEDIDNAPSKLKTGYEGCAVYVLCEDDADRKVAKEAVAGIPSDRIVAGIPHDPKPFKELLLKVKACRHYLGSVDANKLNAQTESRLRDLFDNAEDGFLPQLQRHLDYFTQGDNSCWYGKAGRIVIDKPTQPHKPADDICDLLYTKSCRIKHADLNLIHDDKWLGGKNSALKQAVSNLLGAERVHIDNGSADNHGDKKYLEKVLFKGAGALRKVDSEGLVTYFECIADPDALKDDLPVLKELCSELQQLKAGAAFALGSFLQRMRSPGYGAGGTMLVLCLAYVLRAFGERLRVYKDSTMMVEASLSSYDEIAAAVSDPSTKLVLTLQDITPAQHLLIENFSKGIKARALKHGQKRSVGEVMDLLVQWWTQEVQPVARIGALYEKDVRARIEKLCTAFSQIREIDRFEFLLETLPEIYLDGPAGASLSEDQAKEIGTLFAKDVASLGTADSLVGQRVAKAVSSLFGEETDLVGCEQAVMAWYKGLNPNQRDLMAYDEKPEAHTLIRVLGTEVMFTSKIMNVLPRDFGFGEIFTWTSLKIEDYAAKWRKAKEDVEAAAIVVPVPEFKAGAKAKELSAGRYEVQKEGILTLVKPKAAAAMIYSLNGIDPKKTEESHRADADVKVSGLLADSPSITVCARSVDADGNASAMVKAHITNKAKEFDVVINGGDLYVKEAIFKFPQTPEELKAVLTSLLTQCVQAKVISKEQAAKLTASAESEL